MDQMQLQNLGLNGNESKVYYAILSKGQATAAELVKFLGIHRNIIYDNLEKLIEKGLVSYLVEGSKKKFIAEDPMAIIEYLETKKSKIDQEIKIAEKMLPDIQKLLESKKENQEVSLFKGVNGIKKILADILKSKEYWVIGISNDSVMMLGETFWENFNVKRKSLNIRENLLFNSDFNNNVGIISDNLSHHKTLPSELTQPTEIMMFNNKIAIIVYTKEPFGMLIHNYSLYNTFRKQFEFLWKIAKK